MKIGYARVSTLEQSLDRQLEALRAEGCDKIFKEKVSGKSLVKRPGLEKAISELGVDDIFVVAEWDRATRSMFDGINIMCQVADRGAVIKILDRPFLDLTTPLGKGLLSLLSAIAQDERERIVRRSKQGLSAAKARGVQFGPKPKYTAYIREQMLLLLSEGQTLSQVAAKFNCHRNTVFNISKGN